MLRLLARFSWFYIRRYCQWIKTSARHKWTTACEKPWTNISLQRKLHRKNEQRSYAFLHEPARLCKLHKGEHGRWYAWVHPLFGNAPEDSPCCLLSSDASVLLRILQRMPCTAPRGSPCCFEDTYGINPINRHGAESIISAPKWFLLSPPCLCSRFSWVHHTIQRKK